MEELMGEQDSQHVNSFFSHIKAFFQEIRNTPMYREFIVDAEELLADVAANPDTLEDPEARVALKGMYRSAIRILKGNYLLLRSSGPIDINTIHCRGRPQSTPSSS